MECLLQKIDTSGAKLTVYTDTEAPVINFLCHVSIRK